MHNEDGAHPRLRHVQTCCLTFRLRMSSREPPTRTGGSRGWPTASGPSYSRCVCLCVGKWDSPDGCSEVTPAQFSWIMITLLWGNGGRLPECQLCPCHRVPTCSNISPTRSPRTPLPRRSGTRPLPSTSTRASTSSSKQHKSAPAPASLTCSSSAKGKRVPCCRQALIVLQGTCSSRVHTRRRKLHLLRFKYADTYRNKHNL